jgi:acetyl-CoA carboxylase carboxyltransferase component
MVGQLVLFANQRNVSKTKGRNQFGGVIYSDSADKQRDLLPIAAKEIPRHFLQDVTSLWLEANQNMAVVKDGAKW